MADPIGQTSTATESRSPDPRDDPPHVHGMSTSPALTLFNYINIRGLIPQTVPSKVPYIQDILTDTNSAAYMLTETWLNDAESKINGYSLFRMDRNRKKVNKGRSSGGVGIYLRDDFAIQSETLFTYGNGVIESIGVMVKPVNLLLLATYRSPDNRDKENPMNSHKRSTNREFTPYLTAVGKLLSDLPSPTPDIMLMGDYITTCKLAHR